MKYLQVDSLIIFRNERTKLVIGYGIIEASQTTKRRFIDFKVGHIQRNYFPKELIVKITPINGERRQIWLTDGVWISFGGFMMSDFDGLPVSLVE